MKYKVVGWCSYDDYDIPDGEQSVGAHNAIVDAVRAGDYSFTGWHHQEMLGCTPIMNDGTKITYTQRGWGGLMAEAHGYDGIMDYALFSFDCELDGWKLPPAKYDESDFCKYEDLVESYDEEVSADILELAKSELLYITDNTEKFRYVAPGDTLILHSGDINREFLILDIDMDLNLSEEEKELIHYRYVYTSDKEKEKIDKIYREANKLYIMKLQ